MARISPLRVDEGGPFARVALRLARRKLGRVPDAFAITARHQGVLATTAAFEVGLERWSAVPAELKELATIKAASLVGCEFCLDIGSWLARTHGITETQLRELHNHRESAAFSERERIVLDYAEAMSRTPVEVGDDLFAALRAQFDERQIVELTAMIAWENQRARANAALDVTAQGFSEGAVCAIPAPPPVALPA